MSFPQGLQSGVVHYDPICQLRDHFYFCPYARTKDCLREGSSSPEVRDVICVHWAAHGLYLFSVNMRLLTSSQVTAVSREATKGRVEKGQAESMAMDRYCSVDGENEERGWQRRVLKNHTAFSLIWRGLYQIKDILLLGFDLKKWLNR